MPQPRKELIKDILLTEKWRHCSPPVWVLIRKKNPCIMHFVCDHERGQKDKENQKFLLLNREHDTTNANRFFFLIFFYLHYTFFTFFLLLPSLKRNFFDWAANSDWSVILCRPSRTRHGANHKNFRHPRRMLNRSCHLLSYLCISRLGLHPRAR